MNTEKTGSSLKPQASSHINLGYWLAFFLATYSITEFFTGYHYFKAGLVLKGYLVNGLWLSVFLLTMVYLAYQIYADEKDRDNIRSEFGPFEKVYAFTHRRKQK